VRILVPFTGIVLAGGRSARMGTDKAFIPVPVVPTAGTDEVAGDAVATDTDGFEPMAAIALRALRDAGATPVVAVGGDAARLGALGYVTWPDDHPDEGPLGGLLTGLRRAPLDIVVVLTCDMPAIDAASVRGLVQTLSADIDADVAIPLVGGVAQVLTAAYRRRALAPLETAFAAGERSVKRAVRDLRVVRVDHLDPSRLVDLDRPEDVENYARSASTAPVEPAPADSPPASPPRPDVPPPRPER
jgi:molybdopterin-guanine dinucleotide biosynthesis protein A